MSEEIIKGSGVEIADTGEDGKEKVPVVVSETSLAANAIEQKDTGAEKTEGKYHEILSKVVPAAPHAKHDDDVGLDAKSIGETIDEESKVQKLLDLASTKGVVHAVKVARRLSDYYSLDRMHDELADKLYDGLLERGLITKE